MAATISPIACLECGAALAERRVAGEVFFECASCGSARVPRSALNRLRDAASAGDPSIDELLPGAVAAPPEPKGLRQRRCPACQGPLQSHAFGGGNVRVESCEACEVVYLGRMKLGAILKEARDGIEMSEDARAALVQERMLAAGKRLSAAELGLSTGVLVALVMFFRIVVRVGFSLTLVAGAAAIAVGVFVYRQRNWRRARSDALEKMDRFAEAEVFRLEQKGREAAKHEDEAPVPAMRSDSIQKSAKSSRPRLCPVCNAKLPGGTTHCGQCDSDFG